MICSPHVRSLRDGGVIDRRLTQDDKWAETSSLTVNEFVCLLACSSY